MLLVQLGLLGCIRTLAKVIQEKCAAQLRRESTVPWLYTLILWAAAATVGQNGGGALYRGFPGDDAERAAAPTLSKGPGGEGGRVKMVPFPYLP